MKTYVDGLIEAKDMAKKMAEEHYGKAQEAFKRLKEEFYPLPYNEHTEEQKETRRVLQNCNLVELAMSNELYALVNELWGIIIKEGGKKEIA